MSGTFTRGRGRQRGVRYTCAALGATVLLALAATSPAALGETSPSARSARDWIGWRFLGTTCVNTPQGLEYAHIRVRMIVYNSGIGRHWASNMRVRARLVPPGAGLNINRSWRTQRFPVFSELLQDHSYAHNFAVNTDVVSPNADWRVQLKLIWDRKAPFHDVVHQFNFPFRTDQCRGDAITYG